MKIKSFLSFFFLTAYIVSTGFSQSDLQKMLNSANAIKKNSPAKKPPTQTGLPAGYDNSWKVMATLTRTMTVTTDLISTTTSKCKPTKKGSYHLTVNADFSSDQTIGWTNGDDFTLMTNVDAQLKPFMHPFKGAYQGNSNGSSVESNCDDVTNTESTASANIDPGSLYFSFSYNSKRKQGSFVIDPEKNYTTQANGKMTYHDKNNSGTANTSDLAKAEFNLMFGVCSVFSSFNYQVSKDANIQQTLQSSPVNGGLASIGETKYGYDISYSESKTVEDVPNGWTGTNKITYTTSVHILITNQDPPKYDAIVEAISYPSLLQQADYKTWIPQGPPIPDPSNHKPPSEDVHQGNSIAFRVYIVDKKNPDVELPNMKFTVEYKLTSSKEKGICMNYPAFEIADEKPDLVFDSLLQKKPPNNQASYSNDLLKSKEDQGNNFFAIITSYDYGSFGSLKTKVTINVNGEKLSPIYAHFKDDKADTVSIPYDKNQNQIADEWEKQMGILDQDLTGHSDDDDKPDDLNKDYVGDGLSTYEEYRGFSENHKHIRTDPTKRDIMICDEIKGASKRGISMFQAVTGLIVHDKFTKEEFGKKTPGGTAGEATEAAKFGISPFGFDRTVNFNKDPRFNLTDQHGIVLMPSSVKKGFAQAVTKTGKDIGTPGNYYFLVITADFNPKPEGWSAVNGDIDSNGNISINPNSKTKILTDEYAVAVAHEMLHCVNVQHHGDNDLRNAQWGLSTDKKNIWEYSLDENGNVAGTATIQPRWDDAAGTPISVDDPIWGGGNVIIPVYIGAQNGEHSGFENCIMRYDCATVFIGADGNRYMITSVKKGTYLTPASQFIHEITGTELCTTQGGTGVNAADHKPRARYGDADKGRGNCKKQVKISDQ